MTRTAVRAVATLVAVGTLYACHDPLTPTTHPVLGNAYDATDDCLQPQQSFDFADGPAPSGTCDVVCITDAKTGNAFVTDQCGPYPVADTVEGADAGGDTCSLALAAWAAGKECGAASDAGDDATDDGASEAETEAGPDAAVDGPVDAPIEAPSDAKGGGG